MDFSVQFKIIHSHYIKIGPFIRDNFEKQKPTQGKAFYALALIIFTNWT
jgi:hypothetical protein